MKPILWIFCLMVWPVLLWSQTVQTETDTLKKQMISLENKLNRLEESQKVAQQKNELDQLLQKAESLAQKNAEETVSEKKFHGVLRQQSAMNPNISVGGEFYFSTGSSKSQLNRERSETEWGIGRLFMREIELGVESALDPFSRGKVFIGMSAEEVSVEEAYLTWLNCPLNMNLKLGKFKAQFGHLNRYHNHALPQFDRPRALVRFFGNETLHGIGVSGNILLPSLCAHVNELDLEMITGGDGFSFTDEGRHKLIYVSHIKNYYDLNSNTFFEFGLSGAAGKNDALERNDVIIGGMDIRIKWIPAGLAKYSGCEWLTEFLVSRTENGQNEAWGGFSTFQLRTGARTVISARLDYTQMPWEPSLWERGGALALDYWQSEFVFLRFQYTYLDRNFDESDHRFIFHTCWAMGPHKHEAY